MLRLIHDINERLVRIRNLANRIRLSFLHIINETVNDIDIVTKPRVELQITRSRLPPSFYTLMSKEILHRLSERTTSYQTNDHDIAEALEKAGFYPEGTVYLAPSTSPKVDRTAIDNAVKELEYQPSISTEGKKVTSRLAAHIDNGYSLSESLLKEVQANPNKLRRARELGLLPSGD